MPSRSAKQSSKPFCATHPLGLPRPIDTENIFGAKGQFFALNLMPIPTGCLAHFDRFVYRPHAKRIISILRRQGGDWSGAAIFESPPRYCFLHDGEPAEVPQALRALLPEPPRVSLEALLSYFDSWQGGPLPIPLLDVLTLVSEDIGPVRFADATAAHPWVAHFMR